MSASLSLRSLASGPSQSDPRQEDEAAAAGGRGWQEAAGRGECRRMNECGKRVEVGGNGGCDCGNPVISPAKAGRSGDLGT